MNLPLARSLLATMWRIRRVEETIAQRYAAGAMRCPIHLSIGQEAVAAAVAACTRPDDYAVSTHRGHAHYLAKGGDLHAMIAELHGKATGCSGGKGGSMHLIDTSVGFMGTSAIVGNNIPVGVGLALALQQRQCDAVSFIFLGDGAIEEGVFYESVNFAVVRQLPAVFVCENNLYSVYSALPVRQPVDRIIADMVTGLGIAAHRSDGMDAIGCHAVMKEAVTGVRQGKGPVFLEFSNYRWREHCGPNFDNDLGYRSTTEFNEWQTRDPISRLADAIRSAMSDSWDAWSASTQSHIQHEITAAFAAAEAAPFPSHTVARTGEYAQ